MYDVKRRVLDPLGRHRGRHLLELAGEAPLLGPVLFAERLRELQEQHVADEAEHAPAQQGVAGHRPANGELDVPAIGVVHAVVGDVRTVDGKAGDHLPQRLPQRVEGEVARPARLLCQPVELVRQHVQLARERHLHDQQLLLVDHLGEARVVLDPAIGTGE